jgi:hypothetical protein
LKLKGVKVSTIQELVSETVEHAGKTNMVILATNKIDRSARKVSETNFSLNIYICLCKVFRKKLVLPLFSSLLRLFASCI